MLFVLTLFSLVSLSFQIKKVLLQSSYPMANCTTDDDGKTTVTGIEVNVFNEISSAFNLVEGDWEFECVASEASLYQKLQSDPSTYIAGFGSLKTSLNYQLKGFTFSTSPTLHTGLSVLVAQSKNNWMFLKVFSIQTAGALLSSAIVMAILHYYLERGTYPFERYLWNAFASMFFVTMVRLKFAPARIIQVVYWFIILIVVSSYGANLTAIMTSTQSGQDILTVANLKSTVIKTPQINMPILPLYGAQPLLDQRVFITDGNVMKDLEQVSIDGYALEDSMAQILSRQNCQLSKRVRLFHTFNYVLVFGVGTSDTVIDSVNLALENALENAPSMTRIEDFMQNELGLPSECDTNLLSQDDKLRLKDIAELGYMLGGALIVAIFLHLISKMDAYKRMQETLIANNILCKTDDSEANHKVGDELVVDNLKKVIQSCVGNLEGSVNERLDEMEDKITKFYETLLQTQGVNNDISNQYDLSRDQFQFDDSKIFPDEISARPNEDEIPAEDVAPFQSPTRSLLGEPDSSSSKLFLRMRHKGNQ